MNHGPVLKSERLILRRWSDADREPYAALNADPDVMRHFPAPMTHEESDAQVERIEAGFEEHGFGLWAIEVAFSGEFIGFTGLSVPRFHAPAFASFGDGPVVEIGWRLARSAWGHGYASEAARRSFDFAFTEAGLELVVSFTAVPNLPSQAVMQRIGMTHDPADDFDHPMLAEGHPLRRHVLWRMTAGHWPQVRDQRVRAR